MEIGCGYPKYYLYSYIHKCLIKGCLPRQHLVGARRDKTKGNEKYLFV